MDNWIIAGMLAVVSVSVAALISMLIYNLAQNGLIGYTSLGIVMFAVLVYGIHEKIV